MEIESNNTTEVKHQIHCQYALSHVPNAYKIINSVQLYFVLDILTREWRKLHIEVLNELYCSLKNFWVKNEMGRHCSTYGVDRRIEGKRPLLRHRRIRELNIKINLLEVRCWRMDWIELALGRERRRALVNAIMNLRVP